MRIGLFHTAQWPEGTRQHDRYEEALAQAITAEELGFDSVWLTEHHFFRHGIISDSLSVLAYLAARTTTIRLGTAVAVLPLHNPIRLAETSATIDLLSGGRLDFGIGKGYQTGEFKGLGVDMADRDARFQEALELLVKGWTNSVPFSHSSKFWTFEDANPQPKPHQRPHPPLWLATESESGFRMIAENDWGLLLPQGRSPRGVAEKMEIYRTALREAGREFDPDKVILARALYCAPTDDQAWNDVAQPYLDFVMRAQSLAAPGRAPVRGAGSPFELDDDLKSSALFGGPEKCVEMMQEIRDIGIERVLGFVNIGGLRHEQIVSSLKLFSSEVLPAVAGPATVRSGHSGH